MRKQNEGDSRQRRARAKDAREAGLSPSGEGVTTGGSKQRRHRQGGDTHGERMESIHKGKQQEDRSGPTPRPGSRGWEG